MLSKVSNVRVDVLCGQINLQKGRTGLTNLLSYLDSCLHTKPPKSKFSQDLYLGHDSSEQKKKTDSFLCFLQEPPTHENRVIGLGQGNHVFTKGVLLPHSIASPKGQIIHCPKVLVSRIKKPALKTIERPNDSQVPSHHLLEQ